MKYNDLFYDYFFIGRGGGCMAALAPRIHYCNSPVPPHQSTEIMLSLIELHTPYVCAIFLQMTLQRYTIDMA